MDCHRWSRWNSPRKNPAKSVTRSRGLAWVKHKVVLLKSSGPYCHLFTRWMQRPRSSMKHLSFIAALRKSGTQIARMQCRTTFLGSGNAVDNFLPMPMQQGYWKTRTLPWKHWKETACDLRKFKHIATHQPSMCYQIGMHLGIKSYISIGIMRYTSISGCFSVHHRFWDFKANVVLGSLPSTAGSRPLKFSQMLKKLETLFFWCTKSDRNFLWQNNAKQKCWTNQPSIWGSQNPSNTFRQLIVLAMLLHISWFAQISRSFCQSHQVLAAELLSLEWGTCLGCQTWKTFNFNNDACH